MRCSAYEDCQEGGEISARFFLSFLKRGRAERSDSGAQARAPAVGDQDRRLVTSGRAMLDPVLL